MKHKLKFSTLFIILFGAFAAQAQDATWSLERCITYAQSHNITLQQAQANVRLSLLSEKQAKAARLPNVSGSFSAGEQFGRTIDPTTNTFRNLATGYNSYGLSAGVQVFNGGQIHHSVKQAGWDMKAAQADAEQSGNSLALQVAQAYLSILLAEEQLQNARQRVTQSQQQLNVTQKLIEAGTVPMGDKYNIIAEIARNEQAAVTSQNSLDLGYLTLKQLLQLEPDFAMQIERPLVEIPADADPDGASLSPVYNIALGMQPNIRAADARIQSAEEGISIAKSAYFPSVSLFANLNSNYSTQGRDDKNPIYLGEVLSPPQIFIVNGVEATVQQRYSNYDYAKSKYGAQLNQNFGQSVGVSINIPIYQNGRTRLSVERARLNVLTAQMQNTQTRQQLKNDIQTAIANARSARLQLDAAQKTFEATQMAFQNTDKRHQLGAVNTLDLTTAKNNLDIAENDLVVAKYDYIFKLKILDFYQGKTLTMNK